MRTVRCCFHALVFLLSIGNLLGQDPVLKLFTTEDGLPGGRVYSSIQDKEGYIWSACERGLTRFDGNSFKLYTVQEGLPSNDVWQIVEDPKGRLWIGTFLEITYIEDGKVKFLESELPGIEKGMFKHTFTPLGHIINSKKSRNSYFLSDKDSLLYVKDDVVSFLIENEAHLIEKPETSFLFNEMRARLKIGNKDSLLLFDESILTNKDGKIEEFLSINRQKIGAIRSFNASSILIVKFSGELWLANDSGLSLVNIEGLFKDGSNEKLILTEKIAPNRIWFKTNLGNYVTDTLFNSISEFNFLKNYTVNTIMLDKQENLWLSTNEGLYFVNKEGRMAKSYTIPGNRVKETIKYLAINSEHKIVGLSESGNVYEFNYENGLSRYRNLPKIENPTDLAFDIEGNLWLGGEYLFKILPRKISKDPDLFKKEVVGDFPIRAIKQITFHKNGNSLMSSSSAATKSFDLAINKWLKFGGRFYGLALMNNGNFWVSGKNGVQFVSSQGKEILIHKRKELEIFDSPADNIALDNEENLWIAVNNKGVYRYDGEKIDSIVELSNILINSLQVDKNNRLWAATNSGLAMISSFEYSSNYDFRWYKEIDGLISNDVNEIIIDEKNIVVATEKGITVLQDENIKNKVDLTPLRFSNLKVNDKDTTILSNYKLNPDQNSLMINYECLDFKNLGNLIFQYKMEGIDNDWTDTQNYSKEYPLLTPGNYTFLVRRKPNNISNYSRVIKMYFEIKQPFFRRAWVILSLFLFACLLTYWFVQKRVKQIKTRAEKEIKNKQKIAELELNAFQSQLNPHFVFNALDSIQSFIFKKDARIANRYLVKFSRLMRLFLESSKEKYIFLNDEIKLLQFYIELEKIRFEDKFEFEMDIANNISPGTLEIPSMLLHPFVENAINHGLVHREDSGILSIKFTKENNKLNCRIEDNGIGRKKAEEIKAQSIKSYKSRGMQLVQERQKIWNEIGNSKISIHIEDLYDKNKLGIGTIVDVSIDLES